MLGLHAEQAFDHIIRAYIADNEEMTTDGGSKAAATQR
jgi:hypothetical protein